MASNSRAARAGGLSLSARGRQFAHRGLHLRVPGAEPFLLIDVAICGQSIKANGIEVRLPSLFLRVGTFGHSGPSGVKPEEVGLGDITSMIPELHYPSFSWDIDGERLLVERVSPRAAG